MSIFTLIASTFLYSGERGWICYELAETYYHHSEIQREWAMELIDSFPFQGGEQVLDFGCGDGKITAWISQQAPHGFVTGYDVSTPYYFQDTDALINWYIGTGSPNWGVPFSISRSVFTEFVQKLLESNPTLIDSNGRFLELIPRLHVIARRKG